MLLQPFLSTLPVLLRLKNPVHNLLIKFVEFCQLWVDSLQLRDEAQGWHEVTYDDLGKPSNSSVDQLLQLFLLTLILYSISIISVNKAIIVYKLLKYPMPRIWKNSTFWTYMLMVIHKFCKYFFTFPFRTNYYIHIIWGSHLEILGFF